MATVALAAVLAMPATVPDILIAPIAIGKKVHDGSSLYIGKHYVAKHERTRRCIRGRESHHHYHAVSASGTYRGAYQFSPALRTGAAWMIQKDLRKTMHKTLAHNIGNTLRKTSMNKWHPFWQDYAFWIVWDNGNGKQHWAHQVPGTGCF
jgi:hypothetical protein